MIGTSRTKILVGGNKTQAQNFIGQALSQMEILLKQMSFGSRNQGVRRLWLSNKVYVECRKCFGYQECRIWVEPERVLEAGSYYKLLLVYGDSTESDGVRRIFQENYQYKYIVFKDGSITLEDPDVNFNIVSALDNKPPSELTLPENFFTVIHEWTKTLDKFMVAPFVFSESVDGINPANGLEPDRWAVNACFDGIHYDWEEVEIEGIGIIEEGSFFPGIMPEANYVWNRTEGEFDRYPDVDFKGFVRRAAVDFGIVPRMDEGESYRHVGVDIWSVAEDEGTAYYVGIMCDYCGKEQGFLSIWKADHSTQKMLLQETIFSTARNDDLMNSFGLVRSGQLMGYGYEQDSSEHVAYWFIPRLIYGANSKDSQVIREVLSGPEGHSLTSFDLYSWRMDSLVYTGGTTPPWGVYYGSYSSWCWNPTSRELFVSRCRGVSDYNPYDRDNPIDVQEDEEFGFTYEFHKTGWLAYRDDPDDVWASLWFPRYTFYPYEIIKVQSSALLVEDSYEIGGGDMSYSGNLISVEDWQRYLTANWIFNMGSGHSYQLAQNRRLFSALYEVKASMTDPPMNTYELQTWEGGGARVEANEHEPEDYTYVFTEPDELSNNPESPILALLGENYSPGGSRSYVGPGYEKSLPLTRDPTYFEYMWTSLFLGGVDQEGNQVPVCGLYREQSDGVGKILFADSLGNTIEIGSYERAFIVLAETQEIPGE